MDILVVVYIISCIYSLLLRIQEQTNVQLEAPQIIYPEELTWHSFPANNKWQFHIAAVSSTNLKRPEGHFLLLAPWADASGFIHTYSWASQALEIAMVS